MTFRIAALAIGACAFWSTAVSPTEAQTRLGNDAAAVTQALVRFGYEPQHRLLDREFVRTVVEACRGGEMFRVSVNLLGAVKTKERRGTCDIPGAGVPIPIQAQAGGALQPPEVRRQLRAQGYSRIEFTDRQLPRYVAQACDQQDRRLELFMNRRGEIRRSRQVGTCAVEAAAMSEEQIVQALRQQGYARIDVQNAQPPYRAIACQGDRRLRLVVNRRGEVRSSSRDGTCRPLFTEDQITAKVSQEGFSRLNVKRDGNQYRITACEGPTQVRLVYDVFGDRRERSATGRCTPRNTAEVLSRLEERGANSVQLFVEGCFRNARYRWSFDRLGERTGRQRIGDC